MTVTDKELDFNAVSPLDGRYRKKTAELAPHFSQLALDRARTRVEVEYLISLAQLDAVSLKFAEEEIAQLREIYEKFSEEEGKLVAKIEREGYEDIPATNHDVKAVEYFIRKELKERGLKKAIPLVHFALTSEDTNNLAYGLMIKGGLEEVLLPKLGQVQRKMIELAEKNKGLPLLARTHGQPATPTTLGKEMAVFVARLKDVLEDLAEGKEELKGKMAGASGNLNAHRIAYPAVNWIDFSKQFVKKMGLRPNLTVTQIEPHDSWGKIFLLLTQANNVLIDMATDIWQYVSYGYLIQRQEEGEVGSSTMPHKLNPIDFENAEGNLNKSNSDLEFLARYLSQSRMQRDLSDSTVTRNIGVALAHALIGFKSILRGLNKLEPSRTRLREDLEERPEIMSEAWQTLLRKNGEEKAYETIKDLTRGKELDREKVEKIVKSLSLPEGEREKLENLSPSSYIGEAEKLTQLATSSARKSLKDLSFNSS